MASLKHIHVVSFDNPYPPNYGGVIDVYYKLKALHHAGIRITLHAFEYGRTPAKELNRICDKVFYYQRRNFVNPFLGTLPYIVNTRNSEELLKNLQHDRHPILFEGLHTCFFLNHNALRNRFKIVRTHNIEHDYYSKLENVESTFFKKYFFSKEATRLKEFESVLHHADLIIGISKADCSYLKSRYKNVKHITAFHPNETITSKSGSGNFAFYHGKLSVGENDEAARFLVTKVFNSISYPLQIAGDKPSKLLTKALENKRGIVLQNHVSTRDISQLIAQAHINVLPTFQNTGIKLKLLNVLFQGRHVVVNREMVENTGLEKLCHIAENAEDFKTIIQKLSVTAFSIPEIEKRKKVLDRHFNNTTNAQRLIKWIEEKL